MSRAALTLHFQNEETLRNLERVAGELGVSTDELAEAAIVRELAAVGAGLEGRLSRALSKLKAYTPADLDRDIKEFARSELESAAQGEQRHISIGLDAVGRILVVVLHLPRRKRSADLGTACDAKGKSAI